MIYQPDKWVVLKISTCATTVHKVFGMWYGGYMGSDSWRMNSGITSVQVKEDKLVEFYGSSGSVYSCDMRSYGCTMYGTGVLSILIKDAEEKGITVDMMPLDTDFSSLEYGNE